jgi:chemotaxis signal transduction protein
LRILSGVSAATFSISMPPSVEAMRTGTRRAVDDDPEVVLLLDVERLLDEDAPDSRPSGPV